MLQTCLGYIYFDIISWTEYPSNKAMGVQIGNPEGKGPPLAQQTGLDRDDRVGTSFGETGSTDDSARGPRKAEHC